MEGVSLLEILKGYTIKECGLQIHRICPIRIEIFYGRGKIVGDFNIGNIIFANFTPYADNVYHIKISNKLIPYIHYFLSIIVKYRKIFKQKINIIYTKKV